MHGREVGKKKLKALFIQKKGKGSYQDQQKGNLSCNKLWKKESALGMSSSGS